MAYTKLLAAIDLYETEQPALKRAVELNERYRAKLDVVHVVPYVINTVPYAGEFQGELLQEAERRLQSEMAKLNLPNLGVHLKQGNAGIEVAKAAKELGVDLIVVGSHGKHGVDLLLGSTANAVVHQAPCSVLTVRIDANDQAVHRGPYRKIVVAADLEKDNAAVLDAAVSLAKDNGAELFLIHVVPEITAMADVYVPSLATDLKTLAEEHIKPVQQRLGVDATHTRVLIGLPKHDILQYANDVGADLIVIGSHGRKALAAMLLGATANAVLHGAKTDVLVVRM